MNQDPNTPGGKNSGEVAPAPFRYTMAGLEIHSDIRLSGVGDDFPTDGSVRFSVGAADTAPGQVGQPDRNPALVLPFGDEFGSARVARDGSEISTSSHDLTATRSGDLLRLALPFASILQGKPVLHASAVRGGLHVAAFVGASGVGKSTLAHALAERGFLPVTDDLLPCREIDPEWIVPIDDGGHTKHARLRAVCFLSRQSGSDAVLLERLAEREALVELLRHGFGELAVASSWAAQFDWHVRLASQVPSWSMILPDDRAKTGASADEVASTLSDLLGG